MFPAESGDVTVENDKNFRGLPTTGSEKNAL
jgi:hypothetical protein